MNVNYSRKYKVTLSVEKLTVSGEKTKIFIVLTSKNV